MNKWSRMWGSLVFSIKAKWYGVKCSGKVECYGPIHLIRAPFSRITFGRNVSIISSCYRASSSSVYAPTKLQTFRSSSQIDIGEGVGLNGTSITSRSKKITIGSGTIIAPNVVIMDSDFHAIWPPENRLLNPAFENDKDVTIGSNVWIGTGCIILKGVTIGDNSIIGAGSVVTKDIPPNVIAAGTPAKFLKHLERNLY